jgi:hypothetical protein
MIVTLYSYVPPEYGNYKYPEWAQVFGWFVAVVPLLPIPVLAIREIRIASGETFLQVCRCNSLFIWLVVWLFIAARTIFQLSGGCHHRR